MTFNCEFCEEVGRVLRDISNEVAKGLHIVWKASVKLLNCRVKRIRDQREKD